jgi:hypothetical protein
MKFSELGAGICLCNRHSTRSSHRSQKGVLWSSLGGGQGTARKQILARTPRRVGQNLDTSSPLKSVPYVIDQSEVTLSVSAATEPGVILGTVSYLSPEQARGLNNLDGRSDQFSFGLMLYELVTGSRAFDRPSGAETMAAVIHDETPPLATSVPFPFRLTIERCLAKEPTHRYENTRDLFLELKQLREHALEIATGPQVAIGAIEARVRQRSTMWLWLALVALVLAVGIYLARKTAAPTFQRLTYRRGDISGARFSPDGHTILFSAQWSNQPTAILSMRMGNREFRPLDLPTCK